MNLNNLTTDQLKQRLKEINQQQAQLKAYFEFLKQQKAELNKENN